MSVCTYLMFVCFLCTDTHVLAPKSQNVCFETYFRVGSHNSVVAGCASSLHIVASSNTHSPLNNNPCDHGLKPEIDTIREKLKPMQLVDDTLLVTTVFMSREDLYHAVDAQLPNDRLVCQGA